METPRKVRLRQSVSRKSHIESPVDSPEVRKSLRKSMKEKSDSPDENKAINAPKSVKTSRLSTNVVDLTTPDNKEVDLKATATTLGGRRKSTRNISPENFSPKKLRLARTPSTRGLESIVLENSPSIEKLESPSQPQSERKAKPRYSDINLKINVKDQTVKRVKDAKAEITAQENHGSSSKEEFVDSELAVKPTTLFDDEEDVEGQKLYSFKTPKKRDSMAQLVHNTPKTPQRSTPKTPKNNRLSQIQNTPTSRPLAAELAKTPRHVRAAIKKSKLMFSSKLVKKYKIFFYRARQSDSSRI